VYADAQDGVRIKRFGCPLGNIELTREGKKESIEEAKLLATPLAGSISIDADALSEQGDKLARVHAECASNRFSYRIEWTSVAPPRDQKRVMAREKKVTA